MMRTQTVLRAALGAAALLTLSPVTSAAAPEACADIDNDIARLQCYDGIYPPRRGGRAGSPSASAAAPSAPPPVAAAPPPPPATPANPEAEFGLSHEIVRRKKEKEAPTPAPPPIEKLVAKVDSTSEQANGSTVAKLDNGQTWVLTKRRLGFSLTPGETVTITRGVLSSYWLQDESKLSVRVRRLR